MARTLGKTGFALVACAAGLLVASAPDARAQGNSPEVDAICKQVNDYLAANHFPERLNCNALGSDVASACAAINGYLIHDGIGIRYHCPTRRIVRPTPEVAAAACARVNAYLLHNAFLQQIDCAAVPDYIEGACDSINEFLGGAAIPARYECAAERVIPSSEFTFGETSRDKRHGTATLTVNLPGPGTLTVAGSGLTAQIAGSAAPVGTSTAPVRAAGLMVVTVQARGQRRTKLKP